MTKRRSNTLVAVLMTMACAGFASDVAAVGDGTEANPFTNAEVNAAVLNSSVVAPKRYRATCFAYLLLILDHR